MAAPSDPSSLLDRAGEELLRSDVKAYGATLEQAVAAGGSPEDHARAVAEFANYEWRIIGDVFAARQALESGGQILPAPLLERSRLELSLGNFENSRAMALAAASVSRQTGDLQRAHVSYARAVVAEVAQAAFAGSAPGPEFDGLMHRTLDLLRPCVTDQPGLREPSKYALLAALWVGDGTMARQAWESYFRLVPSGDIPAPLTRATLTMRTLPAALARASPELQVQIVDALAAGRLFREAAALAVYWGLVASKPAHDVLEYARWIGEIKLELDKDYRQAALGHKLASGQRLLEQQGLVLWRALHGSDSDYSFSHLYLDLADHFGAVVRVTSAGMNYGHIISDRVETIEQYGRRAELRSLVLDNVISNGYSSWLWDGRAEVGGWDASENKPATIVSLRFDTPLTAWAALNDPEVMRRNQEDLARWNKRDDELAQRNPYAYLPGLRLRMFLGGARRVNERERAFGLKGPALRAAFLAEYERLLAASSISAHEGRHVLDKQSHELTLWARLIFGASEELEYRAKLSQVVFAPDPLIAMNAIFSGNIGQKGDAHGMANLRVMRGLVAWMESHTAEITGLNRTRPLLPQFDLLTDDQMRAAFRSMDPWAASRP
jgi:hypothetical protein